MEALIQLYSRDLEKLIQEIKEFQRENDLWVTTGNITNSAGNLCLHLVGNLNHFIGSVIGNSGYVRNREGEFQDKNIGKEKLIQMVYDTKKIVISTLQNFDTKSMQNNYPIQVFGNDMTYAYFLLHLSTHLNYHLGQINYLRRSLKA